MPEAELRGRLTVDSSQLQEGKDAARQFGEDVDRSLKKGTDGASRLGESLGEVSRRLATGDIRYALEGIGEKLIAIGGIAGIAAAGIGLAAFKSIEAWNAYAKVLDDVEAKFNKPSGPEAGKAALSTRLQEDMQAISKVTNEGAIGGFFRHLNPFAGLQDLRGGIDAIKARLDIGKTLSDELAIGRQKLDLQKMEAAGDEVGLALAKVRLQADKERFEVKRDLAKMEEAPEVKGDFTIKRQLEIAAEASKKQIDEGQKIQEGEITKKSREAFVNRFKDVYEKSGLSAEELRGGKGPLADRLQLQLAAQHERAGEFLRLQGDRQGAFAQFTGAEGIKAGISNLRDTDKMPEYLFKNAIDSASIFKEIKASIDAVDGSIKGISFKNSG